MMRRLFAAISRNRPRVLTVVVLAAVATAIVLANLSEEFSHRKFDPRFPPQPSELEFGLGEPLVVGEYVTALTNMSYGWPLLWRQHVITISGFMGPWRVVGEFHSVGRLAGNVAIWLCLLALPVAICEWMLRRYRPRPRFSMRAMLVAVGLAAALCGWFAVARNRANAQDALIAASESRDGYFWVERWGPKWLELIGADRYCRRIVGAALIASIDEDRRETQQTFKQLSQLYDLEYLSLYVDLLSPEVIEGLGELRPLRTLRIEMEILTPETGRSLVSALGKLPRLRVLSIDSGKYYAHDGASRVSPTPNGAFDQLERLNLAGRTLACEDLAGLAGLKNLKSVALCGLHGSRVQRNDDLSLLANLPTSTHFESLDLFDSRVGNDELQHVAALTQLKSLSLIDTDFSAAALVQLAPLESLEELAVDNDVQASRGCEAVHKLKRLKKLHIEYFDEDLMTKSPKELRDEASGQFEEVDDEYADWLQELADLREAKPDLEIDGDIDGPDWSEEELAPKCEQIPSSFPSQSVREAVRRWKEQQAAQAASQSAAGAPASN